MSTWSEDFDRALADSPWVPVTASGSMSTASPDAPSSNFIIKHARHPSRPGYIVLLTDLSSVYMEELTAPSVPSRIREVARLPRRGKASSKKGASHDAGGDDQDMDDIIKQSEAALKKVQTLCGSLAEGGDDIEATVDLHDYHDGVLTVRTDSFSWIFYLTELKGRQPLELLSTQLIAPLADIALDEEHKPKKQKLSPISLLHQVFKSTAGSGIDRPRALKGDRKENPELSPSPVRSPPRRHAGRTRPKTVSPGLAEPERTSNINQDEQTNGQEEGQETPEYTSPSPPPKSSRRLAKSNHGQRSAVGNSNTASENLSPSPQPADDGPSATAASSKSAQSASPAPAASDPDEATGDGEAEAAASQAASQAKSQTKRQREEAEEAELEKKAEEMKRKMARGGGGGVLGRRRLRR